MAVALAQMRLSAILRQFGIARDVTLYQKDAGSRHALITV
jgi:hypothetical protein